VLILPSQWWGWAPPFGYTALTDDPLRNLTQFIIPAAINGLFLAAILLRLMRTQMLEVLRQDYVRTARSKGLHPLVIIRRHAMKNALLPVITFFGLTLANALSGAVILESIFTLPGLGTYGVDAVTRRDSPALQGFIVVVGLMYVLVNLAIDLSYVKLNPRVRLT
jgi:peptide/nickel transport system permease protein